MFKHEVSQKKVWKIPVWDKDAQRNEIKKAAYVTIDADLHFSPVFLHTNSTYLKLSQPESFFGCLCSPCQIPSGFRPQSSFKKQLSSNSLIFPHTSKPEPSCLHQAGVPLTSTEFWNVSWRQQWLDRTWVAPVVSESVFQVYFQTMGQMLGGAAGDVGLSLVCGDRRLSLDTLFHPLRSGHCGHKPAEPVYKKVGVERVC